MAVREKRGRTTELTHGTVAATDYTTKVDYGDGLGVVTLTNQIRIVNDPAQAPSSAKREIPAPSLSMTKLMWSGFTSPATPVARSAWPIQSQESSPRSTFPSAPRNLRWDGPRGSSGDTRAKSYRKEFLKDWKEYAYEKFVGWEAYNPWEREEWVVNPPVRPDFRAPIRGITTPWGMAGPAIGAIEDRLARIEAVLTGRRAGVSPTWEVKAEGGCVDFRRLPEGPGPNPVAAPPYF